MDTLAEIDCPLSAALESYSRFCQEQVAPLSHIGDALGARFESGQVSMPTGDVRAYAQFVEMGWQALVHPVEHGGTGFPRLPQPALAMHFRGARSMASVD